jgi:hypothetical protein
MAWRLGIRLASVFIFVLLPFAGMAAASGSASRLEGHIRQDQVWAKENSPYRLSGDLTISKGVTVDITPGVVVRFDKGSRLVVQGVITAAKTIFDGLEDIHNREAFLLQPGSRCRLTHCVIQNLELQIRTGDALVLNNAVSNRNGTGITVGKACRPTIRWNDFRRNSYYAVYSEGRDVIKAPNNFWGAANGPSGAGSGNGDAVNPPVDFRPFQPIDIGEHLVLTDRQLDQTALEPGGRFTLTYTIDNLNSYDHQVILGASIIKDPDTYIHSPDHDRNVTVKPGRQVFERSFVIPNKTPEGLYSVLWGVMKTDLSAYYALAKDVALLRIGPEPTPAPAEPTPGWVPLKPTPY